MFNQLAMSGAKRASDLVGLFESLHDPPLAVHESEGSANVRVPGKLLLDELLSSISLTTSPLISKWLGLFPSL